MKTKEKIKDLFIHAMLDTWTEPFINTCFKILHTTEESKWEVLLKDELCDMDEGETSQIICIYKSVCRSVNSTEESFDEWFNSPEILFESKMWGDIAHKIK